MGGQRTQRRAPDGRSPLWRAFNIYRVIALLFATLWFALEVQGYTRQVLGWALLVAMAAWTAFTIWRYRIRSRRTNRLVLLDQVVVSALFLIGSLVWMPHQVDHSQPSVVSVWAAAMPLVAGLQWGTIAGGISGVFAAGFLFMARYFALTSQTFTNMLLLVGAGVLVGIAADSVRRSTERLATALRAESATAERERLAQSIHDNVLQVLAHVRRRGNELGGEAAELARMAGEQEIALRTLMATPPPRIMRNGTVDFAAQLRRMRTAKVEVSVPAESVELPESMASELVAVVREALANVVEHAGPAANAWVLLENLGSTVVLSIRDDGPGIPEGRLEEAVAEGRMGVAQSIRGRVRSLGGTIELDTRPGEGTEWEIRVPNPGAAGRQGRSGVRRALRR